MLLLLKIVFGIYAAGVIGALSYNKYLRSQGLEGIPYSECFSPIKMFSVLIGFVFSLLLPLHIFEQLVLRLYDKQCRIECLLGNEGKCTACGCNTKAKMFSPFEICSRFNWGAMIWSKKKYAKHRENFPIEITVNYKKRDANNV
jgi:hypothetical protein